MQSVFIKVLINIKNIAELISEENMNNYILNTLILLRIQLRTNMHIYKIPVYESNYEFDS